MGMASSQGRLLSLTQRWHNCVYEAQSIENQKILLATQQDEIYQRYCDALDAKKLTVGYKGDPNINYVDANFSTLFGYKSNRKNDYALVNNINHTVIVDQKTKDLYEEYGNDKYTFAWACLYKDDIAFGYGESFNSEAGCVGIGKGYNASDTGYGSDFDPLEDLEESDYDFNIGENNLSMTVAEKRAFLKYKATHPELETAFDNVKTVCLDENSTEAEKVEVLNAFRDKLYSYDDVRAEILNYMNKDKQDAVDNTEASVINSNYNNWSNIKDEFEYYLGLWDLIHQTGGCEVIEDEYMSGDDGTTWLNNMVNAGIITINVNDREDNKGFFETSPFMTTDNSYLAEAPDDSKFNKAEVEYEHEMNVINKKETRFDQQINKIETEKKAIEAQMDALKELIRNNAERTMGSSG